MADLKITSKQIKEFLLSIAREKGVNELLKRTFEAMMKAEREVYKQEHGDVSNGFRSRRIWGYGKVFELRVPRTRSSGFYPVLLGILKEQQSEAMTIAFELYRRGLTDKEIGEIFDKLYGRHYSSSRISQIVSYVREDIKQWLNRYLESYYPVLYIDAIYQYTRIGDRVQKVPYYVILGLKEDFTREVLSIESFEVESSTGWEIVLSGLKRRGVEKVSLIVSDAVSGIENAVSKVFSGSDHQLCVNHLKRKIEQIALKDDRIQIRTELKQVFTTDTPDDNPDKGWKRWLDFIDKWGKKYRRLYYYKTDKYRLYFTYLAYDRRIRNMIYTTNWIESLNKSFRKVLHKRGAMPSTDSVINLLASVAIDYKAHKRHIYNFAYEPKFVNFDHN